MFFIVSLLVLTPVPVESRDTKLRCEQNRAPLSPYTPLLQLRGRSMLECASQLPQLHPFTSVVFSEERGCEFYLETVPEDHMTHQPGSVYVFLGEPQQCHLRSHFDEIRTKSLKKCNNTPCGQTTMSET